MPLANDIRKGMAIRYNGDICIVLSAEHRTPGNKRGFVQTVLRNLRTGSSQNVRFSSTEEVDVVQLVSRKMEFSYRDGPDYVFTDPETFEMINLSEELIGDAKKYLTENTEVTVLFADDRAVQVELPPSVVLTVTEAPEGVRGDSASNVMKPVVLETGITIQAPLFIKPGEKVRVDTRTGKYIERA